METRGSRVSLRFSGGQVPISRLIVMWELPTCAVAKAGVHQGHLAVNELALNLNAEGDETKSNSQGNAGG